MESSNKLFPFLLLLCCLGFKDDPIDLKTRQTDGGVS